MPKIQSKVGYRQDPPNAIQLELVEGCPLACSVCGLRGIRSKPGNYKMMTSETLEVFCKMLVEAKNEKRWNPRIELASHGEPTAHSHLAKMVSMISETCPRELILVSNGFGLVNNSNASIESLVRAGITSFCLDQYEGCCYVPKIVERYTGSLPIYDSLDEKFRSNAKLKEGPYIVTKQDLTKANLGPYDRPNSHCGAGMRPPKTPLLKRCTKPFRELTVRWDGNVALCCNDFRGIYKIGNIRDYTSLESLWQSTRFQAARRMLYTADRTFVPCCWCDAISPRVGLLPDKYGKKQLEPPDEQVQATLVAAVAGPSYSIPSLRPWEVGGNACVSPTRASGASPSRR